jgi:hypothetical protein
MKVTKASAITAALASASIGLVGTYSVGFVSYAIVLFLVALLVLYPVTALVEYLAGTRFVPMPAVFAFSTVLLWPGFCRASISSGGTRCQSLLLGGLLHLELAPLVATSVLLLGPCLVALLLGLWLRGREPALTRDSDSAR